MQKAITDGFAFVEFVCPAASDLTSLFEKFGFGAVARSARTGAILMQQGDARFVVNPAANEFRNIHGSSVRAIGIKVDDAELALAQAMAGGAKRAEEAQTGAFVVKAPAIMGIGDSLVYFVESGWSAEFSTALDACEISPGTDAAIIAVDHTSNIVRPENLDLWADFYRETFGFTQKQYLDVKGRMTGMRARSMVSPCGKVSIPIAAAAHDQPGVLNQNDEFIRDYHGEGIQHIALRSSNLSRTVDALSGMGIEFMDAPLDSYYGNLNARVPGHGQDVEALKRRGILLDGKPDGKILLQRFTRRQIGPVFFEIIERRGEDGFGEGNFKALFESQESDQVKRGALVANGDLRVQTPTGETLVARAKGLAPLLKKMGPIHDEDRRISEEVASKLREMGLFRITQSVENGGYGMRPSVLWTAAREITRVDPATGWVLSLTGLHPWLVGMFPPEAQDEVFDHGKRDALVLALTGNVGRGVDVETLDDGFELTGQWTYASGVDIADWATVLVECRVAEGKEMMLLLVPRGDLRIDHDSWRTFGMRGTGSKDVYLDHAFVPSHRAVRWMDIGQNKAPGKARNHGPMYDIPHTSLLVMSVSAAVVGAATGMLDLYRETVKVRIPAGLQTAQTEDRFSLVELGKAASQIEMAFKVLMFDVDEMYDRAASGHAFTDEQRARYRTDGAMISDLALGAVDALTRSLGGSLLPNGPIERCFRDVHSMASHFLMQVSPAAELLGRTLVDLPLPPNARI